MLPKIILFASAVLIACDAGFVESIGKCSIKDSECQMKMYELALQSVAPVGIPELDIPVLDPYELKDTSVNIMGMMDMTMVDGVVEGLKDMKFEKYETNVDRGFTIMNIHYDVLTVKGHYTAMSTPVADTMLGNNVTADGIGKMIMEQVKLTFKFAFRFEKRDDGEIYLVPEKDLIKYKYDVVGGIKFEAENIKLGDTDISEQVTSFLNKNWKYILRTLSKVFTDKAVDLHYDYMSRCFNSVPVTNYLTDDLSSYIKK